MSTAFIQYRILTNMKNWHGEFNVAEMTGTRGNVLFACRASVHAINCAELGIVQTLITRFLLLLVLQRSQRYGSDLFRHTRGPQTIVSGYSMCTTLMALISSGERRPNWTSLIVRKGHLEGIVGPGAIFAVFIEI